MASNIEDLFTTSNMINEKQAVQALNGLVTIQDSTKEIFVIAKGLTSQKVILVYALAKKLLASKGHIDNAEISRAEIVENIQMKAGTVDSAIHRLKDKGLLFGERTYTIPNVKVEEILEEVKPNE